MLGIATDYAASSGDPTPFLDAIAEVGFGWVHWGHEWNTDLVYSRREVGRIADELRRNHLSVMTVHASRGQVKGWGSSDEYRRLAGVELVENRIRMASKLSCRVVVLHVPPGPNSPDVPEEDFIAQLKRSMDRIVKAARRYAVRIALENRPNDDFGRIRRLFALHEPETLGLCYDTGHGNIGGQGLHYLEEILDRLIAVHIHDNRGDRDAHDLPFSGTVDWTRLLNLLARSSYDDPIGLEVTMAGSGTDDESAFLRNAFAVAETVRHRLDERRRAKDWIVRDIGVNR